MSGSRRRRLWPLLGALFLMLGVLGAWVLLDRADAPAVDRPVADLGPSPTAHEMSVADLLRAGERGGVVLVLRERGRGRYLPLTIGEAEGLSILSQLDEGVVPPRPLTHDLMTSVLGELRAQVVRAVVTELRDGTFYARLVLRADGRDVEVDSRPSDAIALALRAKAPIYCEAEVLDQAAINTEQTF
jgi:bifunctional DNase/RNase